MAWKTMLVTTDLSEGSAAAVTLALSLSQQIQLDVHLLHVIDVDVARASNADFAPTATTYRHSKLAYEERLAEDALQQMRHLVELHASEGSKPSVKFDIAFGDVVEAIMTHARGIDADVIVLSTHGRRGVSHMLLGSVAEDILRHSYCPILVARRGDAQPPT